jgi:hypothetical protein
MMPAGKGGTEMDFLAVSIDDKISRPLGSKEVKARTLWFSCETYESARNFLKVRYPDSSWYLIRSAYYNRHIVYKDSKLKEEPS